MCYQEIACPRCSSLNIKKNGKTANQKQRCYCKACGRQFITAYTYFGRQPGIGWLAALLPLESCGLRATGEAISPSVSKVRMNRDQFAKLTGHLVEIKKGWYGALKEAGISNLRFHDLRHTFASRLAAGGAHPVEIRELPGHRSSRMTDRYTRANDSRKQSAVESLADYQHTRHKWHQSATATETAAPEAAATG